MWRVVLPVSLLLLIGFQLWGPPRCKVWGCGCGLGMYTVEVRGRLVGEDGAPVAGRALIGFRWRDQAAEAGAARTLAAWGERARSGRMTADGLWDATPEDGVFVSPQAFAVSAGDGTFRLTSDFSHCVGYAGGEPLGDPNPRPRSGLEAILLEGIAGTAPELLVTVPAGTWTALSPTKVHVDPDYLWDLGDVVMPSR